MTFQKDSSRPPVFVTCALPPFEGLQNPEMSMCVNMMCTTAVSSSEDCFLKMSTGTCCIFNSCVHAKTNNNIDLTMVVSMAIVATLVIVEGEHISTG